MRNVQAPPVYPQFMQFGGEFVPVRKQCRPFYGITPADISGPIRGSNSNISVIKASIALPTPRWEQQQGKQEAAREERNEEPTHFATVTLAGETGVGKRAAQAKGARNVNR